MLNLLSFYWFFRDSHWLSLVVMGLFSMAFPFYFFLSSIENYSFLCELISLSPLVVAILALIGRINESLMIKMASIDKQDAMINLRIQKDAEKKTFATRF